jgi:hypothetical protein
MIYTDRFISTDNLVPHLLAMANSTTDSLVQSSFAGFFSVSAVTVFELAIKDIFISFAEKKHKVFKVFIETHFLKINGMIGIPELKGKHIKPFGEKYLNKFKRHLEIQENTLFSASRISLTAVYDNLLTCRHKFVHTGTPTLTLSETISYYANGKEVIHCLNHAMQR